MLLGMVSLAKTPVESLYVHVPFCAQKCSYCAFFSEPSQGDQINRYVRALKTELGVIAPGLKPRTIFFGGGTPSLLNLSQWREVLECVELLGFNRAPEFTVECNPATVSMDKARLLRSFGVNRISMGVQSFDPDLLDRLGRIHTREMVFKSYDILRQAGFDNLNIDLMFAIPGQGMDTWRKTLDEALALGSEHLSTYEVIYEEDTALYAQMQAGKIKEDEDLACDMYELLVDRAGAEGLIQYEVANFARDPVRSDRPPAAALELQTRTPFFACQHNVNYWRGGAFEGIGPSATGYVDGVRFKNWSNTQMWCELVEKGRRPIESREQLEPLGRAGETAAFGLRMVAGWPFADFERVTGFGLPEQWGKELDQLVRQGWGDRGETGFRLTREGLRFADSAAQLFLR
jgi:oxygen-independent coproporphyrinogen-3 oxidase